MSVDPATIVYDGHGNATQVGSQSWWYDGADRVTGTSTGGTPSQTVSYVRDVLGRVASRSASGVEASTVRYGFTGTDDSPDLLLTAGGAVVERYVSLPGGVLHRKGYAVGATGSWSVSNLHGDVIATVEDGSVTAAFVYDPFGQPLNPASGVVDTTAVPATRAGTGTTDGWAGVFQRGYEHTGGLSQTLMGARTYLPALGMFTATDPVAGGNTTTYTYPQDPINKRDYTGTMLSDGPSGSTLNIPLSLPGWKPFNPTKAAKTGTSKAPKGDRRNTPGNSVYIPPRIDPMKYSQSGKIAIERENFLVVVDAEWVPLGADYAGITIGNIYLKKHPGVASRAEIQHESVHMMQWLILGPGFFSTSYMHELMKTGGNACFNMYEIQAGLAAGNYQC